MSLIIDKWLIINCILCLSSMIYLAYGVSINKKYVNECISKGYKVEATIGERMMPSERGCIFWFEYDAKTMESQSRNICFVTSDYFKKGDKVICYIYDREGEAPMVVCDNHMQCKEGNEILMHCSTLWLLTALIFGFRHGLLDIENN